MGIVKILCKNIFDKSISFIGILILIPLFIIISLLLFITSSYPVLFQQERIGYKGRPFIMYKFRTMKNIKYSDTVSVKGDFRITGIGSFLRKYKLDELPELWNVLKGDMSLVGPRPDVPGYADKLEGEARKILLLKPGITGPASLRFSDEEEILAKVNDPIKYNDEIIYPEKVKINLNYFDTFSLLGDVKIILKTIFRRYS
jgi:lipopolysaccharide/colanic/teichoic acid biosynthesis glycosyltransferase